MTSFAALTGSVSPMPAEWHSANTGHAPHAGFRAKHVRRPWKIRWWLAITQSAFGSSAVTSFSTCTGSSLVV